MVVEKPFNTEDLKKNLDSLFDFASKIFYQQKHLMITLQAAKSLIGIDPSNPSKNLLKWLEQYVKSFPLPETNINQESDGEKPDIIAISKFGDLIRSNQKLLAIKYINCLVQVANPQYIIEYILELSSEKSKSHFIFCWYIYKAFRNIDNVGQVKMLLIATNSLFDHELKIDEEDFKLLCIKNEVSKSNLIRYNSILPNLEDMKKIAIKKIEDDKFCFIEKMLAKNILTNKEQGLNKFLHSQNLEDLNSEKILILDSIRSAIKFHSSNDGWSINNIIKKRAGLDA